MLIVQNNKKYSLCYYLKKKLNNKYKKVIKYNKYHRIYNPRKEIIGYSSKNKFNISK